MVPCHPSSAGITNLVTHAQDSSHPFLILISIFVAVFAVGLLLYAYRRSLLSNYRVRGALESVLGRHQPDWMRYPSSNRPPVGSVSGTGFVNPVYTPLESRY